jgi:Tfp pilus assembly protein PilO
MASLKKSFEFSTKQSLVDKDNNSILITLSIASFIVVFCLISANSLYSRINYQNKVIKLRNSAATQLESNVSSVNSLVSSYNKFEAQNPSVVGPAKNSIMVLDALPSKYDFPALVTSLSFLMKQSGLTVNSINGTDAEISAVQTSPNPTLIPINFSISGTGSYGSVSAFLKNIEKSIRPIIINNVSFTGSDTKLTVTIRASTYYQPEKIFKITNSLVGLNGVQQ